MTYQGYLIDLDGTMYRGKEEIAGAKEFIARLNEAEIPYIFITNNSSMPATAVVEKLASFQIETTVDHVLTSALATAKYIQKEKPAAPCYVIGEAGLQEAMANAGLIVTDVDCDYVVVGIDRDINYEKLKKASLLIQGGARFISTNRDAAIPTEEGLVPGNGSLTALLAVSSGVEPTFIGKPEPIIMNEALQMIGLKRDEVLMIGDNYTTDISAGLESNIDTLMVLTGFSKEEDILHLPREEQPTYIMDDLYVWMKEKM